MASKHLVSIIAIASLAGAGWLGYKALNSDRAVSQPSATAVAQNPEAGAKPNAPKKPGAPGGGPAARAFGVELAKVEVKALKDETQAVGNLRSRQSAVIRPEVPGRIVALGFADGQAVQAGQWLVQLDDALQRAEVMQSLAQVSVAQANFKRNQELVAQQFVAQRALDESRAGLDVAKAQLALACARLERMRILAPFSGLVGIRQINVGDFVKDGAELVKLEDVHALYVDFRLPERQSSRIQVGQWVSIAVDALPGLSERAKVAAIDPLIDVNGRFITIRAVLDNRAKPKQAITNATGSAADKRPPSPELAHCPGHQEDAAISRRAPEPGQLRPGMFARVGLVMAERAQALVIPEAALVPQGGKQFVVVAKPLSANAKLPEGTQFVSKQVAVELGLRTPGWVEITQGLTSEDQVVVAGQQRLGRDGSPMRALVEKKP